MMTAARRPCAAKTPGSLRTAVAGVLHRRISDPGCRDRVRSFVLEGTMKKITTFLMFPDSLEEAVKRYVSIFEKYGSKIVSSRKGPDGKMMSAEFELAGQPFMSYEGGSYFSFSNGISLFINCET